MDEATAELVKLRLFPVMTTSAFSAEFAPSPVKVGQPYRVRTWFEPEPPSDPSMCLSVLCHCSIANLKGKVLAKATTRNANLCQLLKSMPQLKAVYAYHWNTSPETSVVPIDDAEVAPL